VKLRSLLATTVLAAALLAPAAAHAGIFPGEIIDGPNPDLVRVSDLDLARDGTGAVVYIRKDAGVDHVFVSRLVDGVWQPPERVDAGLNDRASAPAVAASDGGRVAIAFVSGGNLYAVVRPGGPGNLPAPQSVGGPAASPAVDMSINGAAYIVYTSGSDIRAARLDRTAANFTELGAVLDVNPNEPAGDTDARKPDVAISADGTAVATWGERGPDGKDHVYVRRLFNASISNTPSDLNLADFQGHAGGDADSPDIDIEDDSSYAWVTFRQTLDGQPRAIARRLVGSVFEDPSLVDPLGFPAAEGVANPAIELNGTGVGLAASGAANTHQVYVAPLVDDAFGKGVTRVDNVANTVAPHPLTGMAQNNDGMVAWLQGTATDATSVRVRQYDDKTGFGPEAAFSKPEFGTVDPSAGFDAAVDRVNDGVAVFIQGSGNDQRLVAGMADREPGAFVGTTTQKVRRFKGLRWATAFDLWGSPTYTVLLDDKPVGTTQATIYSPKGGIPDGVHRWRVIATDRRGQQTSSATRLVRVDNTPPSLDFKTSGKRSAGKLLKFRFFAGDVRNKGASGLQRLRVVWGDCSRAVQIGKGKRASHRYRRGRFTIRVSATDKAGNAVVVKRRLVIKKK
jgi:hypothetical protein